MLFYKTQTSISIFFKINNVYLVQHLHKSNFYYLDRLKHDTQIICCFYLLFFIVSILQFIKKNIFLCLAYALYAGTQVKFNVKK